MKKRNSFKDFINNITWSGTFGSAYKIIKDNRNSNIVNNRIIRDDGSLTDDFEGGRKIILKHNFKSSEEEEYVFRNINLQDGIYDKNIEIGELDYIINELKSNKAPGYDGCFVTF